MKLRNAIHTLLAIAVFAISPTAAFADKDGKGPHKADHGNKHDDKGEKAKDAKDAKKDEKADAKDAKKDEKAEGSTSPSAAPGNSGRRELTEEEKKARKEHMAELRAKWGQLLKQPGVKEEMRQHQSRMAKLRRIAKLAKEEKKDAVVKRAEGAMEREKDRHDKEMGKLKASTPSTGSAAGTATAPGLTTAAASAAPSASIPSKK
jgi:hypothetical protein